MSEALLKECPYCHHKEVTKETVCKACLGNPPLVEVKVRARRELRYRECPECEIIEQVYAGHCDVCGSELITLGECPGCFNLIPVASGEFREHVTTCEAAKKMAALQE